MDQPATLAPETQSELDYLTGKMPFRKSDGTLKTLEDVEREVIAFHIDQHGGSMTAVAHSLGISRSTLYRKIDLYGFAESKARVYIG